MRIGVISRCTPSTKTAVFACIGSGNEPHGLALPKVHTVPDPEVMDGPLVPRGPLEDLVQYSCGFMGRSGS
jgi:hypothetical protein